MARIRSIGSKTQSTISQRRIPTPAPAPRRTKYACSRPSIRTDHPSSHGFPSRLITPAARAVIKADICRVGAADLLPWNLFQLNRGGVTTRKPDQVNHCKQMYVCFWIQLVSIAGKYAWQGCSVFPTIQKPACQCWSCTHPDISQLHANLLGTAPSWGLNRTELLECRLLWLSVLVYSPSHFWPLCRGGCCWLQVPTLHYNCLCSKNCCPCSEACDININATLITPIHNVSNNEWLHLWVWIALICVYK